MSSSMACQRFHSFPQPHLADPRPVIQNSPPIISNFTHKNEPLTKKEAETQRDVNGDSASSGGWSFQFLANPSPKKKESNESKTTETENVYVHPLAKRSASSLSKKSLEMCTESLGSETGSETSDAGDEFCSLSPPSRRENLPATTRPKSREFAKKLNFPPPLTSISGSDSVKVRPHRENGRLVIEAVTVSSSGSFFQAERADGRLRLCLVKDAEEEEEEAECEEECCELDDEKWVEGVGENNGSIGGETEISEEEYNCDEFDDEEWVEGVGENKGKFGYEMEIGEIHRPSRCYDNGFRTKGIQSWGPVWVAIS